MEALSRWTRPAVVLVVIAASACSTDGPSAIASHGSPPGLDRAADVAGLGFLIGVDSAPVVVARGTSATVHVHVARQADFVSALALTVDAAGAASGVTATVDDPLYAATDTGDILLTVAASAAAVVSPTPTVIHLAATDSRGSTQTLDIRVMVVSGTSGFTATLLGASTGPVLDAGQSGTVRVVVSRAGDFTGPVTFAADSGGLPGDVTVTQGATAGDTVTLNVAAGPSAAAGSYTVTLRGTGAGVVAQTVSLPVTIRPVGTFAIGASASVSAAPGTSVAIPVRITRQGGFTGPIAFGVSGLPTGTTAVFDTSATGADSVVTLRFTVPPTARPGSYAFSISGTTPGLAARTAPGTLDVAPPGFALGVPTTPLTILAGGSNTYTIPITRDPGFTDSLTITVSDAPEGLTGTATTIPAGGTTSTLTLTADGLLVGGDQPFTVTATTSAGVKQAITYVATAVTGNSSGFVFQPNLVRVSVAAGDSATGSTILARTWSYPVNAYLAVGNNVPAGLTVRLLGLDAQSTTTGGAVGVQVTAAPDMAPGQYTFYVTASSTNGSIPFLTVLVEVRAATPPGGGTP